MSSMVSSSASSSLPADDMDLYATARSMALHLLNMVGVTKDAVPDVEDLVRDVNLTGPTRPFVPTPWKMSEMMCASHLAFAAIGQLVSRSRLGGAQKVSLNTAHASLTIWQGFTMFWSEAGGEWKEIGRKLMVVPPLEGTYPHFMTLSGNFWRGKDGKPIYLFSSFSPADAFLKVMGFDDAEVKRLLDLTHQVPDYIDTDRSLTRARHREFISAFKAKVLEWNAADLEAAFLKAKVGAVICPLTTEQFEKTEQAKALKPHPPIELTKFEGWAPAPLGPVDPKFGKERGLLAGVKVLEMTRVLMGPAIGLQLVNFGATSIRISSPLVQDSPPYDFTMNSNKSALHLDVKDPKDKQRLLDLIMEADIFIQNNAFGALERLGLSSDDLFKLVKNRKKGLIYVEGSSFGFYGPLASAYGFEQLGQALAGLCTEQGKHQIFDPPLAPEDALPTLLPASNCDVNTGAFGALGTIAALWRREREGGSYLVRVSLTQTAKQLADFGRYQDDKEIRKLMEAFPPIASDYEPDSDFYGIGAMTMFYKKLQQKYPQWFDRKNGWWQRFKDCAWGGDMINLKAPIQFDRTPAKIRRAPRPAGYDPDATFDETPDVVQESAIEYRVLPKAMAGKL